MIYYLGFAAFSIVSLVLTEVFRTKIFLYVLLIFAFLFSALRYDAGYDFFSYMNLISEAEGASFDRLEFINKFLIGVARYVNVPQLYFVVTSFIYLVFMILGFRHVKSVNSVTVAMLLFFIGSYLTSFDIIRQMSAVAIVFYATTRLLTKDYFVSFLLAFAAFGLHRSAVIFIFIFMFYVLVRDRRFGLCSYIFFFALSIFSFKFAVQILQAAGLYTSYIESGGNDSGGKIYLMLGFMVFALLLLAKTKDQTRLFWVGFNLFFLGFLIYTVFLPFGYFVTRVSYFLFPWGFVAWSELIYGSTKNRMLLICFIWIFSLVIFFLTLYVSFQSARNPYLNYRFFFMEGL